MSQLTVPAPSPVWCIFVFPDRADPPCSQEHSGHESKRGETNGTFTLQLYVVVERGAHPGSCSHLQRSTQSRALWVKSCGLDRLTAELHAPRDHGVTQLFLPHTQGR